MPPRAYVTLLATPDYLPGIAALSASLRKTHTKFPLFVVVTQNIDPRTASMVERLGSRVIQVSGLKNPTPQRSLRHWNFTYSKLQLFGLTQFEKIIFLDADMMVCANIDDLFDWPHFAAVNAGGLLNLDWVDLNSGLLVIEPNANQHREMLSLVGRLATKDHGDQSFLHAYFPDWPNRKELHLDHGYNAFCHDLDRHAALFGYRMPKEQEVEAGSLTPGSKIFRVVHFVGSSKPWHLCSRARHFLKEGESLCACATKMWYQFEWNGLVSGQL